MEISKDKCALILVFVSLSVLAVDYGLLSPEGFSFGIGGVSFSGNSSENKLFISISAFAIIVASCIFHMVYRWNEIAQKYHEGYRESPVFVELVRRKIAEAVKSDRYGATYGGLKPSFKRGRFDLGRFTTDSGQLTPSVIIDPEMRVHLKGCLSGVLRTMSVSLWIPVYAPTILGIWAACVITV